MKIYYIYNDTPPDFEEPGIVDNEFYLYKARANKILKELKRRDEYAWQYAEVRSAKLDNKMN